MKKAQVRTRDGRFWSLCEVTELRGVLYISWKTVQWSHTDAWGGCGHMLGTKSHSDSIEIKNLASLTYLS